MGNPYKVGDLVRLRSGETALKVARIGKSGRLYLCCNPENFRNYSLIGADFSRGYRDVYPWTEKDDQRPGFTNHFKEDEFYNPEEDEVMTDTNKTTALYLVKVDGNEMYATYLVTDSQGQWVMEPKGGGTPFAIDKASAEKVVPYSVGVTFGGGKQVYQYWSNKEDGLEVGDAVFQLDGALCEVVAVDTKSEKANKYLPGIKLLGKKLTTE